METCRLWRKVGPHTQWIRHEANIVEYLTIDHFECVVEIDRDRRALSVSSVREHGEEPDEAEPGSYKMNNEAGGRTYDGSLVATAL